MTPKDKAKDLFVKMLETIPDFVVPDKDDAVELAKLHALIAVDEILNNFGSRVDDKPHYTYFSTIEYWQQVKTEIENL